jgi:hypothetical protein
MAQWSSIDVFKLKENIAKLVQSGGTVVDRAMRGCESEFNLIDNKNLNRVVFLTGNAP